MIVFVALAAFGATAYIAVCPPDGRDTTAVAAAMAAQGFESWGSIQEQPNGWLVESARDSFGGGRVDLLVDKATLHVISSKPNHSYRSSSDRSRVHCFI